MFEKILFLYETTEIYIFPVGFKKCRGDASGDEVKIRLVEKKSEGI